MLRKRGVVGKFVEFTGPGLSYLGLGTQPPEPSWGGMLASARNYMELSPWMALR